MQTDLKKDPPVGAGGDLLENRVQRSSEVILHQKGGNSAGNLKAHLFDLADQDRQCLAQIRESTQINSNALIVRLAIRNLAKQLSDPTRLNDEPKQPAPGGEDVKSD
jgi:hypothetical protein